MYVDGEVVLGSIRFWEVARSALSGSFVRCSWEQPMLMTSRSICGERAAAAAGRGGRAKAAAAAECTHRALCAYRPWESLSPRSLSLSLCSPRDDGRPSRPSLIPHPSLSSHHSLSDAHTSCPLQSLVTDSPSINNRFDDSIPSSLSLLVSPAVPSLRLSLISGGSPLLVGRFPFSPFEDFGSRIARAVFSGGESRGDRSLSGHSALRRRGRSSRRGCSLIRFRHYSPSHTWCEQSPCPFALHRHLYLRPFSVFPSRIRFPFVDY